MKYKYIDADYEIILHYLKSEVLPKRKWIVEDVPIVMQKGRDQLMIESIEPGVVHISIGGLSLSIGEKDFIKELRQNNKLYKLIKFNT